MLTPKASIAVKRFSRCLVFPVDVSCTMRDRSQTPQNLNPTTDIEANVHPTMDDAPSRRIPADKSDTLIIKASRSGTGVKYRNPGAEERTFMRVYGCSAAFLP